MKNLIILILIITSLQVYGQDVGIVSTATTTTQFKNFTEIIEIPPFHDFNPKKYFKTKAGKNMEALWENKRFLKKFYTKIATQEAEQIKENSGFNIIISNNIQPDSLSPVELFLISAYIAERTEFDKKKGPYIVLNGKRFYISTPLQSISHARCVMWSYENGSVFISKK